MGSISYRRKRGGLKNVLAACGQIALEIQNGNQDRRQGRTARGSPGQSDGAGEVRHRLQCRTPILRQELGGPMRKPVTQSKPAPARASVPGMARPAFPGWTMAVLLALVD